MKRSLRLGLLPLSLWLTLLPAPVFAALANLVCGGGMPTSGSLYDNQASCVGLGNVPDNQLLQFIFSGLICDFQGILNEVLSRVYCGVQYALIPILGAALTLYVCYTGAQLIYGGVKMSSKELVVRLFKIGAVWTFATQADYGIGLAYNFFLSIIQDGIGWVVTILIPPGTIPGAWNEQAVFRYVDGILYQALSSPFTGRTGQLLGFIVALFVFDTALAIMFVNYFLTVLMIFLQSLLGYLMGLASIAFLIAVGPVFLCFTLFKTTNHFFESWIKYLVSYSVQIILIFALLAIFLYVMSLFGDFFTQLIGVLVPDLSVYLEGPVRNPNENWAICPYEFVDRGIFGWGLQCKNNWAAIFQNTRSEDYAPIPISALSMRTDLVYYMTYNLTALIVVAYAFHAIIKVIPDVASSLAGASYVPKLGEGLGFGRQNFLTNSITDGMKVFGGVKNQAIGNLGDRASALGQESIGRLGGGASGFLKQAMQQVAKRKDPD